MREDRQEEKARKDLRKEGRRGGLPDRLWRLRAPVRLRGRRVLGQQEEESHLRGDSRRDGRQEEGQVVQDEGETPEHVQGPGRVQGGVRPLRRVASRADVRADRLSRAASADARGRHNDLADARARARAKDARARFIVVFIAFAVAVARALSKAVTRAVACAHDSCANARAEDSCADRAADSATADSATAAAATDATADATSFSNAGSRTGS